MNRQGFFTGNNNSVQAPNGGAGGGGVGNNRNFAWMLEEITSNLQNFHTTSSTTSNLLNGAGNGNGNGNNISERRDNYNANPSGMSSVSSAASTALQSQRNNSNNNEGRIPQDRHRNFFIPESSRNSSTHSQNPNSQALHPIQSQQQQQQRQEQQQSRQKQQSRQAEIANPFRKQTSSPKAKDLLTCFICLGKLKNAHMCPDCQKMGCEDCIKEWLRTKTQCPHCRTTLLPSKLMKCRFVLDIAQALEKIEKVEKNKEKQGVCSDHGNSLEYFCQKCKHPICSDCGMLGAHKGHTVERLNTAYEFHVELVENQLEGVSLKLKELEKQRKEINGAIENLSTQKKQKIDEFSKAMTYVNQLLEDKHKQKLSKLQSQLQPIVEEIDLLESMTEEVNEQIENLTKSAMIEKSAEIVSTLYEINSRSVIHNHLSESDRKLALPFDVVPRFASGVFMLENYSVKRMSSVNVVYSETLVSNGNEWRLKVYLNGNDKARDEYLSVFLEMTKGPYEPTNFEYRIELMNQSNRNINEARECVIQFEMGACWGYDKFIAIDKLENEGFLLPEKDLLKLKFSVRYPSLFEQCSVQQTLIQSLEEKNKEQKARIQSLEAAAADATAAAAFQRRKQKENEQSSNYQQNRASNVNNQLNQSNFELNRLSESDASLNSSQQSKIVHKWREDCEVEHDQQDEQQLSSENSHQNEEEADDDSDDDGQQEENENDNSKIQFAENNNENEMSNLIDSYDLAQNQLRDQEVNGSVNADDDNDMDQYDEAAAAEAAAAAGDEEDLGVQSDEEDNKTMCMGNYYEQQQQSMQQHYQQQLNHHRLHSLEPSQQSQSSSYQPWEDETNKTEQSQSNFADFQDEELLNELNLGVQRIPATAATEAATISNENNSLPNNRMSSNPENPNKRFTDDLSEIFVGGAPVRPHEFFDFSERESENIAQAMLGDGGNSNRAVVASILSGNNNNNNNSVEKNCQEYLDTIGDKVEFMNNVSYVSTKSADVKKNLFSEFEREAATETTDATNSIVWKRSVARQNVFNNPTTNISSHPAVVVPRVATEVNEQKERLVFPPFNGFAQSKSTTHSAAVLSQPFSQQTFLQQRTSNNNNSTNLIVNATTAATSQSTGTSKSTVPFLKQNEDDSLLSSSVSLLNKLGKVVGTGVGSNVEQNPSNQNQRVEAVQTQQQLVNSNVLTPSNTQLEFNSYKFQLKNPFSNSLNSITQLHQQQQQQQSTNMQLQQLPYENESNINSSIFGGLSNAKCWDIFSKQQRYANLKFSEKVEGAGTIVSAGQQLQQQQSSSSSSSTKKEGDLFFSKPNQSGSKVINFNEAKLKKQELLAGHNEERAIEGTNEEGGMNKKNISIASIKNPSIPSQQDFMESRKQLLNQNNDLVKELQITKLGKLAAATVTVESAISATKLNSGLAAGTEIDSIFFSHSSKVPMSMTTATTVTTVTNNPRKPLTIATSANEASPAISEGSEILQQEQKILQLEKLIDSKQKE